MKQQIEKIKEELQKLEVKQEVLFEQACDVLKVHPDSEKGGQLFDYLYNQWGDIDDILS